MRPAVSVLFIAGVMASVADAQAPRYPAPPRYPEPVRVVRDGRVWCWDDGLEKFRPEGPGWYWDAPSGMWCRVAPAPPSPGAGWMTSPQYHAPPLPPPAFGPPPFAGGGC